MRRQSPVPKVFAGAEVLDLPAEVRSFRDDVLRGLAGAQKQLPCKYFYDAEGSRLFDAICRLDEYYPTRTETALLRAHGGEMAALIGAEACLIEYGCGSLVKTRLLLDALAAPALFVPIDISRHHLLREAAILNDEYPALAVMPVVADFTQPLRLPESAETAGRKRVVFFPGSTIGNFDPPAAGEFLTRIAATAGKGGALLIGVDLKKDEQTLVRAYDDRAGVTAAFNLNMLARINRELAGDFDLGQFRHRALYDRERGRIEMHLVSRREQTATVLGRRFRFRAGETIHTENSYKYDVDEFAALAAGHGFAAERTWIDPARLFSLIYLTVR
ncbi:MAG: L-histidine N(alpha)-methyltransferase [Rhodospirillales bacterium]|nr:L-histidine N(alpha)-methyltransferase [Rhodospirillales bacterium]